jgi:hypothetical protein
MATPQEEEARRRALSDQSTGWDALNKNAQYYGERIPLGIGPTLSGIFAASRELEGMSPEERRRSGIAGQLYRAGGAAVEGFMKPIREDLGGGENILFGDEPTGSLPVVPPPTIAPKPLSMEDAIREGGGEVAAPQGPITQSASPQAAGPKFKSVIVSRPGREGEGRIVFETVQVPIDSARSYEAGPGAASFRSAALAENPMRAAGGLNPSGAASQGFQVRENAGGFSPSRQIPLDKSFEEVFASESPLIQEKWLEAKRQGMALRGEEGALQEQDIRRQMLDSQAGLAKESLAEVQDPRLKAQRELALWDFIGERSGQDVAARARYDVDTAERALRAAGRSEQEIALARELVMSKYLNPETQQTLQEQYQRRVLRGREPVAAAAERTTQYP